MVADLSGVPIGTLEAEARAVHQLRGTTEYSLLLDELPSLQEATADDDRPPSILYKCAIQLSRSLRHQNTKLYPGVVQTLTYLQSIGVPVVAYTESIAYWTRWRIKFTGLDGLINVLYSSPDHDLPWGVTPADIRTLPPSNYELPLTEHRHVKAGILKPSPFILTKILDDYGLDHDQIVYVGDSLFKDVAMAQKVGLVDVHAAYGVVDRDPRYEVLRRVSHWTDADIARERLLANGDVVVPTFTLSDSFDQILDMMDFRGRSASG